MKTKRKIKRLYRDIQVYLKTDQITEALCADIKLNELLTKKRKKHGKRIIKRWLSDSIGLTPTVILFD